VAQTRVFQRVGMNPRLPSQMGHQANMALRQPLT
jgi:hypothetical protein